MKILVISQHLFPMQTPRAHRTTELVKELGRQGHSVTLYAVLGKYDYATFEKSFHVKVKNIPLSWMLHPYNSDNDKKRTLLDKILGRLLKKQEFPNIEFRFQVPKILAKDHDYDALITIADPHQIHWGTAQYRTKNPTKFPKVWIADCGDPFMLNGAGSHKQKFEKWERLFCEQADFITVPVENGKLGYYPEYRTKIEVIPQGFEFELAEQKIALANDILTFAFAGNFYQDIRNPKLFLEFLASTPVNFRFIVYTPFPDIINQYKGILGDKLRIEPALERSSLLKELEKMDFLVNIENVNSPAQVPSKLIDYAITGRPILSVNPQEINKDVIAEFLSRDYRNAFVVDNLEQYQISNVAKKFVDLINK